MVMAGYSAQLAADEIRLLLNREFDSCQSQISFHQKARGETRWEIWLINPQGLTNINGTGGTITDAYNQCCKQLIPIDTQLDKLDQEIFTLINRREKLRDIIRKQNETPSNTGPR